MVRQALGAPAPRRLDHRRGKAALVAVAGFVVIVLVAAIVWNDRSGGGRQGAIPRLPVLAPARDVYDGDVGDPFILATGGARTTGGPAYVLFGTDDPPDHIPTATSIDGQAWSDGPDALPQLPAWADPDPHDSLTWAPAALAIPHHYLLYVSVQETASRRQCIAVTEAATPEGPYTDALGAPLVCQRQLGGSIDPSVLSDSKGAVHLVWKSDGNCCGLPTALWEQDLASDGLHLIGRPHQLLTADEQWQGGIVENPALIAASGGGWWLFYSGNRFDVAAYATGVAWCPTLTGTCRETSTLPFLSGTSTQFSPGGLDFFRDGQGRMWASFATWNRPARNGRFFCCRSLNVAALTT